MRKINLLNKRSYLVLFFMFAALQVMLSQTLTITKLSLTDINVCSQGEGSLTISISGGADGNYYYKVDSLFEQYQYVASYYDSLGRYVLTIDNLMPGTHQLKVRYETNAYPTNPQLTFTIANTLPGYTLEPVTGYTGNSNGSITFKSNNSGDLVSYNDSYGPYFALNGKKFSSLYNSSYTFYYSNTACSSVYLYDNINIPFENSFNIYNTKYDISGYNLNIKQFIDSVRFLGTTMPTKLNWFIYDNYSSNYKLIGVTSYPQVLSYLFKNTGSIDLKIEAWTDTKMIADASTSLYAIDNSSSDAYFYTNAYGKCGPQPVGTVLANNSSFIDSINYNYIWLIDNTAPLYGYTPSGRVVQEGGHKVILEIRKKTDNSLLDYHYNSMSINEAPKVSIVPVTSTVLCPGEEFKVNINSNTYTSVYIDDQSVYSYNGNQYNYKSSIEGNHVLRVNYYNSCTSQYEDKTFNFTYSSTAAPKFPINAEYGNQTCPGDQIQFRSSHFFAKNIQWNFGDGSTSTLADPVHSFVTNTPLYYVVTFTATNTCGVSGSTKDTIRLINNLKPMAGFMNETNYQGVCTTKPIQFKPQGRGTALWSFGDGTTSNVQSPLKTYVSAGNYNVKLVITNGCGMKDSSNMMVVADPGYTNHGNGYLDIENDAFFDGYYGICPGSKIKFKAEVERDFMPKGLNTNLAYDWILPDGTHKNTRTVEYTFSQSGMQNIVLNVANDCGGSLTKQLELNVNTIPGITTYYDEDRLLIYPPTPACPGDKVILAGGWNDQIEKYTINWGDGVSEASKNDPEMGVAGTHSYASVGNYVVSVKGTGCTAPFFTDTVRVISNANNIPLYYFEHSAMNNNYETEGVRFEKLNPTDHEFTIPVKITNWSIGMDSTVYLYVWYGSAPSSAYGQEPNYSLKFKVKNITSLNNLKVYIPIEWDPEQMTSSIGFAMGFNCDGSDEMPTYSNVPAKNGIPVYSYSLVAGGKTIVDPLIIDDVLSCTNTPLNIFGEWGKKLSIGNWRTINFDNYDYGSYYNYYLYSRELNNNSSIDNGKYIISDDTLKLLSDNSGIQAQYIVKKYYGGLKFNVIGTDLDSIRFDYLKSGLYTQFEYDSLYSDKNIVCPGDSVQFTLFGGKSFKINFGDGSAEATVTNSSTIKHKYTNIGNYSARVYVTTGCGKIDTFKTTVRIAQGLKADADFDANASYQLQFVGDTAYYRTWGNGNYVWHFSDDNTTQKGEFIKHIWAKEGEVTVSLKTTNGCGDVDSTFQNYVIRNNSVVSKCYAGIAYNPTDVNKMQFYSIPFTSLTTYKWDFGDNTTSSLQNPEHNYAYSGNYNIKLIASNASGCSFTAEKVVDVYGYKPCSAYFDIYSQNGNNIEFRIGGTDNSIVTPTPDKVEWDFGDGVYDVRFEDKSAYHSYLKDGWYLVKINVTTGGCTDYYELWVNIKMQGCDPVSFNYSVTGNTVKLINTTPNRNLAGRTFYWYFSDGDYSYETDSIVHTFEYSGYQYVQLEMYTDAGCYEYFTDYIYVIDSTQTFAQFDATISGDTVKLKNNSRFADTWYWDLGDGRSSSLKEGNFVYSNSGYYDICLTVKNKATGETDEYCLNIKVGDINCKAEFAYKIDNKSKTVIFADSSKNASEYYWSFGDWDYSSQKAPTHQYLDAGSYDVCLSIYNSNTWCYADICKTINLVSSDTTIVTADFEFLVDDATKTLYLTSRSSKTASDFYWTLGDGTFKTGKEISKTYTIAGNYQVCLKAFNKATQKSDRKCEDITVGTLACNQVADFTQLINGTTVKYRDKSTGKIKYRFWDFGDGSTSTAENPGHTYAEPGYYVVSLAISDSFRVCTDMKIDVLKIGEAECKAGFTATVDPATRKVVFANKSIGKIRNYYWSFGDFDFSVLKQPLIHTYSLEGMYNVNLTVLDSSGLCMDFYKEEIQVGTVDCNAKWEAIVDSANYKAFFKSKVLGQFTYALWSMGDGKISTEKDPVHKYKSPGYYTVGLGTYNPVSGCMDYYEDVILIGSQDIDCEAEYVYQTLGKKVKFKDKSKGTIVKYNWNFGDGQSAVTTSDTVSHAYTKPGFYNVCLQVTNKAGITNLTCDYIAIAPEEKELCKADFNFTVDNSSKKVSFKDASQSKAIAKYYWDYGNTKSDSTILGKTEQTYTTANYYLVSLKIKTITGCTNKTYKLVNVALADSALKSGFGFDVGLFNQKAGGYPVDFIGTGVGDHAKLRWDFGDGSSSESTTMTPSHTYVSVGKYNVCLTISDPVTKDSSKTCSDVLVTCEDKQKPTAICKDTTITLSPTGAASIKASSINNKSTDDCTAAPLLVASKTSFTVADIGVQKVTLTVTDASNNISTCVANVTVLAGSAIKGDVIISGIECSPNPFGDQIIAIDYAISKPSKVVIELFDMSNRMVAQLANESRLAGKQSVYYNGTHLSSGSYLLQLKTSDGKVYKKILIKQ